VVVLGLLFTIAINSWHSGQESIDLDKVFGNIIPLVSIASMNKQKEERMIASAQVPIRGWHDTLSLGLSTDI